MAGMSVGGEDMATELGAIPSADSMYVFAMQGLAACRTAGILPMGSMGQLAKIDDLEYVDLMEELGYSHLWVADSQMLWSDCYAVMALAAARTKRLHIGTGVAVVTYSSMTARRIACARASSGPLLGRARRATTSASVRVVSTLDW